jgi:hypothetical protein
MAAVAGWRVPAGWRAAGWRGAAGWRVPFPGAGVPDRLAVRISDGQAPAGAGAGGDGGGEVAAGGGVEVAVAGGFAGPAGQPEPGRQRDGEVDGPGEPGRKCLPAG